jgi:hypothetical protein
VTINIPISIEKCKLVFWLTATLNLSKLRFAHSLCTVFSVNLPIEYPNIPCSEPHTHFPLSRSFQRIRQISRSSVTILNIQFFFYGVELLASRPTTKLEDHSLLAVHDYLFNILAATLLKLKMKICENNYLCTIFMEFKNRLFRWTTLIEWTITDPQKFLFRIKKQSK